jgi:hypothetical protein
MGEAMAEHVTTATLGELENVRAKVRADRRPASMPLAVLGGAMTLFAVLQWIEWSMETRVSPAPFWPWFPEDFVLLVVPIGFVLIALRYRAVERHLGVRTEWRVFLALAVVALISLLVAPRWLVHFISVPFGVTGLSLLVVAWWQRSGLLAVGALIFGVGGVLETFRVLTNRVYEVYGGFISWASVAVWTLLTVALWALAVVAYKREVGT